jgi:hypothetical protein
MCVCACSRECMWACVYIYPCALSSRKNSAKATFVHFSKEIAETKVTAVELQSKRKQDLEKSDTVKRMLEE